MSHRCNMSYPKKREEKFTTVRIPKTMKKAIEDYLKSEAARNAGFFHVVDVVTAAIREYLYNMRFSHFNLDVEKGIVRVRDYQLGIIADVYFRRKDMGPVIICEYCRSSDCEHVHYALTIPKVQTALERNGWIITEDGQIKRKTYP